MLPGTAEARQPLRVGRYVVRGRIGRGGMGMVYRAVDEALEREVALKTLISEGGLDSEGRRRFEVEAKAAARLQHPNIVIVYELGEDRGVAYIAMELLPGIDLEALLRSGEPMPLEEKLDVVAQICRGLAYAHERGIVHRDIKPSNVRLLDDGSVKIMDFGIAKLGSTQLTKAGMMVGTVHYMSPEQVRGRPLDGRSDVFSVGVILYELLAGQRPFRAQGTTEVLYKIVHEEPPVLDLRSLGELGQGLAGIVAGALTKNPEQRHTATTLARALQGVLDELRRIAGEPPAAAVEALASARHQLRAGRADEATAALRALTHERPEDVEAQRLLRVATRQLRAAGVSETPIADEYPELEATFQATRTRRDASLDLAPTLVVGAEEPTTLVLGSDGAASPAEFGGAPAPPRTSRWLWLGAGLLLLAALAGTALLLHASAPAARIAEQSRAGGAPSLVDGRDSGATLRQRAAALVIRTTPAGATLVLDGARLGTTPLETPLDDLAEHRLEVALEGYLPQEVRIARGERPAAIDLTLRPLPPPGRVAVVSSYPLDVVWHGRTLAHGANSPRVSVPGGRQTLTLVARSVFLRAEVTVEVPSGAETVVNAPATGKLNVRAQPDNCEVFVDGTFVDYPPILDRPAAAGRHVVGFRWPDGSRAQETAMVEPGAPAFVIGRKAKE